MEMQACPERRKHLREMRVQFRGLEVEGVMCGEQKDLGVGLVFHLCQASGLRLTDAGPAVLTRQVGSADHGISAR